MSIRSRVDRSFRPHPSLTCVRTGLLQRKCACGGSPGPTGECEECRKKRQALNRKARQSGHAPRNNFAVPPVVGEVLHSAGQPLDPATRAFMEPRFGHDFSQVRVHADKHASESARAVDALAYAVGRHIVFGSEQYVPATVSGKRLIARELTHVVEACQPVQPDISRPAPHEALPPVVPEGMAVA